MEILAALSTFQFPDVVAEFAVDEAAAEKLWQLSEQAIRKWELSWLKEGIFEQ